MMSSKNVVIGMSAILIAGIAGTLSACNSTSTVNFLKTVSLSIAQEGSDEYFKLTSTFDLGNVSLAEMTVGIIDPHTQQQQGSIEFTQLANGQSQIALSANTNLLSSGTAALGTKLPNGNTIPAALGAASGDVLGIQILDHSVLYLGGSTATTAYVGVALGIKGFDEAMSHLSTQVNVFFMGTWNSVLGLGGIYTSTTPNESGIAIFGKYTHPAIAAQAKSMAISPASAKAQVENDYAIEKLNNYNANKLMKYFYGKKRVLKVN